MQHFSSSFKRRSIFIFVILFAITLPFPLSFFPVPGEFLHAFLAKLNSWSAENLLGLQPGLKMQVESDSTGFYIHVFHLVVFSIAAGLAWTAISRKGDEARLKYIINTTATYILAFFLLKYGFDKVFKFQFYLPEPNTLYTPMGFLSKDILFWSTVGSSYSYSVFSGIIEVIPALLLFSRKTRLLGGLIAFGVMLHVLLINFSFDISVKILSMYLLLLCMLVIGPYLQSLANVFISRKTDFPRPETEKVNADKKRWMRFLKAAVIVCLLFESLYTYVDKGQFNDDLVARPKFHGAYRLIEKDEATKLGTSREKSVYFGDLSQVRRVFIHRSGYFIFQFQDDSMQDFQAVLNSADMTVKTHAGFVRVKIYADPETDHYSFSWEEAGQKFRLVTDQLDLGELPLLKEEFTWAVE